MKEDVDGPKWEFGEESCRGLHGAMKARAYTKAAQEKTEPTTRKICQP